jgi:hypothetical protein
MALVTTVKAIDYININVRRVKLMKSYMVFECEGFRFTWAGGNIINIHQLTNLGAVIPSFDAIEYYGLVDSNEDIAAVCLDWLVENMIIDEAELYSVS